MPVEIFTRAQFEAVLDKLPLGFEYIGCDSGQLEYKASVGSQLQCPACRTKFYVPQYDGRESICPACKHRDTYSDAVVQAGEMQLLFFSSIDPATGKSRASGKDSIRILLISEAGYSKVGRWTTRLPGWEDRLLKKARELWGAALDAPRCKNGHKGLMFKTKSGQNHGRWFWKCIRCQQWLAWL